jgi:predicted ATP-dependent endonuclease of OLD family
VLIGKNESGKSNVLKALSLINSDTIFEKNDLREGLPTEEPVEDGFVYFIFELDKEEHEEILNYVISRFYSQNREAYIFSINNVDYKLDGFLRYFQEILLVAESGMSDKRFDYWEIKDEIILNSYIRKPKEDANVVLNVLEGKTIDEFDLIDTDDFDDLLAYTDPITIDDILNIFFSKVEEIVKRKMPETILWSYNDKNLLPSSIDILNFATNPDICTPLKSMFNLSGYTDINKAILDAQKHSNVKLRNLLNGVALNTTTHFRKVWPEYSDIEFELIPNGTNIDASIKDAYNRFELAQRSDGFKRFVSFLLLISAKVEKNILSNALLLFDEPDLGLHPSGIRFLRDELIKISKNNYVVYSTHSIFMIDKDNISRHYLVSKSSEVTNLKTANESNFSDEEVLYNALGYSVFENLKEFNIIFEGWKDKSLFNIALTRVPNLHRGLKKLKDFGLCHAKGVKDVKHVASILELAGRQYIVVSDGDAPAKERQKDFADNKMQGVWMRYDELIKSHAISTSEDFIKVKTFIKVIDELRSDYSILPKFTEVDFSEVSSRLQCIENKLRLVEQNKDSRKKIIDEIKNKLFEQLQQTDIEEYYYDLMSAIQSNFLKLAESS